MELSFKYAKPPKKISKKRKGLKRKASEMPDLEEDGEVFVKQRKQRMKESKPRKKRKKRKKESKPRFRRTNEEIKLDLDPEICMRKRKEAEEARQKKNNLKTDQLTDGEGEKEKEEQ